MVAIRIFLFVLVIQCAFSASAKSAADSASKPQKYAISQQVGSTCFLSCWYNLGIIKTTRSQHNGQFLITSDSVKSRIEWFRETSRPFAQWYKVFNTQSTIAGSAFATFVERVKSSSITIADGCDRDDYMATLNQIDQRASTSYFPHLLSRKQQDLTVNNLYLPDPVMVNVDVYAEGTVTLDITVADPLPEKTLGHMLYCKSNAMLEIDRAFYNFGLYKLMLMAAGVKSDNTVVADGAVDPESLEILQLHKAMKSSLNPWNNINLDHFLEYQVANLFIQDARLKAQAMAVVDVFFKTFGFYSDAQKLDLSAKMYDLPGEEQMLSYCFCQSLRKLSAASIGEEAAITVLELEAEEVEPIREILRTSISQWFRNKFVEQQAISDGAVSFADVWQTVKSRLNLADGSDRVTFSGHGAVLSFDSQLIAQQNFDDPALAKCLGFVTMDSSYAKGLKPFYQIDDEP